MSAFVRKRRRDFRKRVATARARIGRLERCPPGYRRVWLVLYRIGAEWQSDGEWFASDGGRDGLAKALAQAIANAQDFGWPYRVKPFDVPEDVFATRGKGP